MRSSSTTNIITKFFLFSILFITSQCSEPNNADLYIHNINGYTISGDTVATFTALAIKDGKIVAIGDTSELNAKYQGIEMLDLEGRTVIPGLIDAHGHVMGLGYRAAQVNLEGTRSVQEALDRVKAYAENNPDADWILGRGWNQVLWAENAFPTGADLDAISDGRPIYLTRVDGHAAWANSVALGMSGISRETVDPQGGLIIRDRRGDPTGILIDNAMNIVDSVVPSPDSTETMTALIKALEELRSLGITSTHDAGVSYPTYQLYKNAADQGLLKTRIYGMISGVGNDFDQIAADGLLKNYLNDFLSVRSVKLYGDGALGSRGAAMIHPYHDEPSNSGLLFYGPDSLSMMIGKAVQKGYQVNVHAIGDAANRVALDAYQMVQDSIPSSRELRHRIEHAQIIAPEDFDRFVSLNIIASMQPVHATSDMNMAEDRVGSERILGGYAWQTFLDKGVVLASGSDYPVENANPFHGLYAAVTRSDTLGNPLGGWYPEQKLSRVQALRSFTIDAAYAGHQEQVLGTLETGKWADFIVIDQDYFSIPESDIWRIKVLQTFVAGKRVYSAP
jgi:predicted amidohydrolase YtcJ